VLTCWLLVTVPPAVASQYHPGAATETQGAQVMPTSLQRIDFERSGGPIHLTLHGTVRFQGQAALVTSDPGNYRRELAPDEVQFFDRLDLSALGRAAGTNPSAGSPDRYQYDVVIARAGGERTELRFREEPVADLNQQAPGLGDLAQWVRREIGAIWKQRGAANP
jgi:hypothetical protein